MQPADEKKIAAVLDELLGYLNFSSGANDPRFLGNLNALLAHLEPYGIEQDDSRRAVQRLLDTRLTELEQRGGAFRDSQQARGVLNVVFNHVLAAYRRHHQNLLFHQPDRALWRPLMLGRVFESVLKQGGPWDEIDRITAGALEQLNDYVGHRPVAVLRSQQRIEPYRNELVRPIPLFVQGAGVAPGKYRALIEQALAIINKTDRDLLAQAQFDPSLLDELALDPRAYDFDHPVNKRPNYLFGQWDPHHLDKQGRYRRFVLQQVTLDALLERVEQADAQVRNELLLEAATVLAGTILMASATSGSEPGAHASDVTLATLVPRIARMRDVFYKQILSSISGEHGARLAREADDARQPLAGARQHLNQYLSRLRAAQLEHVHVALLFSRMGYTEAALGQAHKVQAASARIRAEIDCRISAGSLSLECGEVASAASGLRELRAFLQQGIQCGALADPWNVLGFQGHFSLFPAPENSVVDHRIDQLISLVQRIVALHVRVVAAAAAQGDAGIRESVTGELAELAAWWDKFATTTVEGIQSFVAADAVEAAKIAADALESWQAAGSSAGNISFWRRALEGRQSAEAYSLIAGVLFERHDLVSAMALLMQWLSEAGQIPLKRGEHSFFALVKRWLAVACARDAGETFPQSGKSTALVTRFFDFFEANADEFWQFPELGLGSANKSSAKQDRATREDEDDDGDLFRAAYDEMVYVDSTSDGFEGDMLEEGSPKSDYELELAARELRDRLRLMDLAAEMWKLAALRCPETSADVLTSWRGQAERSRQRLLRLLEQLESEPLPAPGSSRDMLLEYDRRRAIRDTLLEQIIGAAVDTSDVVRILQAKSATTTDADPSDIARSILQAVLSGDAPLVRSLWRNFESQFGSQPLLYVPLSRGGGAGPIVATRVAHELLRELAVWLPRLALVGESCRLVHLAREMEAESAVGAGAVSEFDRLFDTGYRSLVEALVRMSDDWSGTPAAVQSAGAADAALIETLEQLTEMMLQEWLAHSRSLRLSVLEKIPDEKRWQELVSFIEKYGHDLFNQRFLNLGNLRAILHEGVDRWLDDLESDASEQDQPALLRDLGTHLPRQQAVASLTMVMEAIAENYSEYRDYNSTTTQSDRGELIYTLLDFLRLRVAYDRVAWHLRPVMIAHEVLVQRGRLEAAERWRRALAERTAEVADVLLARYAELRKKYGMRLATIGDRLAERFVRPLLIHRLRALVPPAIDDARRGASSESFRILEQEIDELLEEPSGVGLELPGWLTALEEEVERRLTPYRVTSTPEEHAAAVPRRVAPLETVQREIADWDQQLA